MFGWKVRNSGLGKGCACSTMAPRGEDFGCAVRALVGGGGDRGSDWGPTQIQTTGQQRSKGETGFFWRLQRSVMVEVRRALRRVPRSRGRRKSRGR